MLTLPPPWQNKVCINIASKFTPMHLSARLHQDPLGDLTLFSKILCWIKTEQQGRDKKVGE